MDDQIDSLCSDLNTLSVATHCSFCKETFKSELEYTKHFYYCMAEEYEIFLMNYNTNSDEQHDSLYRNLSNPMLFIIDENKRKFFNDNFNSLFLFILIEYFSYKISDLSNELEFTLKEKDSEIQYPGNNLYLYKIGFDEDYYNDDPSLLEDITNIRNLIISYTTLQSRIIYYVLFDLSCFYDTSHIYISDKQIVKYNQLSFITSLNIFIVTIMFSNIELFDKYSSKYENFTLDNEIKVTCKETLKEYTYNILLVCLLKFRVDFYFIKRLIKNETINFVFSKKYDICLEYFQSKNQPQEKFFDENDIKEINILSLTVILNDFSTFQRLTEVLPSETLNICINQLGSTNRDLLCLILVYERYNFYNHLIELSKTKAIHLTNLNQLDFYGKNSVMYLFENRNFDYRPIMSVYENFINSELTDSNNKKVIDYYRQRLYG